MRSGYDILLKSQCSETMSSLKSEEVLESIQNEQDEDVSSRLCERIAFLIYQDSNFGLLPVDKECAAILSSISHLCKSRIHSSLPVDGETFVGRAEKGQGCLNFKRERIIAATLLSSRKEDLPELLDSVSSEYPSSASLAQRLLNNDERFLASMLILLSAIDEIPTDSIFHPISVFLEAMHLINYDCEVLIDWLNSELSACSLLLRTLKSNCNAKSASAWRNYSPIGIDPRSTTKKWREERIPMKKPIVTLKIIEVVGDQKMTKQMEFCGLKTRKVEYEEPESLENLGSFDKWKRMVVELRARLRRLLAANLIARKSDVLLKWCDKFCDLHC